MTNIKIHWSFWLISSIALVWNVMGSLNFIMQMDPDTLANYPESAQALIVSRPSWATIAFAVAVFGGAIGDILLLLKKAIAYYLFTASLLGVIFANIHTLLVTSATDILIGSFMSLVVSISLIIYTRYVKTKGWIN